VFIKLLHKKMFGDVWKWAGKFRKSNKNIGVAREQIGIELRKLYEDVKCWNEFGSWPVDEIAARFHHRLVWIHPFVNGNGRHARVMTDLILEKKLGARRFTWGNGKINQAGDCRQQYIQALQTADKGDFSRLLHFVRL